MPKFPGNAFGNTDSIKSFRDVFSGTSPTMFGEQILDMDRLERTTFNLSLKKNMEKDPVLRERMGKLRFIIETELSNHTVGKLVTLANQYDIVIPEGFDSESPKQVQMLLTRVANAYLANMSVADIKSRLRDLEIADREQEKTTEEINKLSSSTPSISSKVESSLGKVADSINKLISKKDKAGKMEGRGGILRAKAESVKENILERRLNRFTRDHAVRRQVKQASRHDKNVLGKTFRRKYRAYHREIVKTLSGYSTVNLKMFANNLKIHYDISFRMSDLIKAIADEVIYFLHENTLKHKIGRIIPDQDYLRTVQGILRQTTIPYIETGFSLVLGFKDRGFAELQEEIVNKYKKSITNARKDIVARFRKETQGNMFKRVFSRKHRERNREVSRKLEEKFIKDEYDLKNLPFEDVVQIALSKGVKIPEIFLVADNQRNRQNIARAIYENEAVGEVAATSHSVKRMRLNSLERKRTRLQKKIDNLDLKTKYSSLAGNPDARGYLKRKKYQKRLGDLDNKMRELDPFSIQDDPLTKKTKSTKGFEYFILKRSIVGPFKEDIDKAVPVYVINGLVKDQVGSTTTTTTTSGLTQSTIQQNQSYYDAKKKKNPWGSLIGSILGIPGALGKGIGRGAGRFWKLLKKMRGKLPGLGSLFEDFNIEEGKEFDVDHINFDGFMENLQRDATTPKLEGRQTRSPDSGRDISDYVTYEVVGDKTESGTYPSIKSSGHTERVSPKTFEEHSDIPTFETDSNRMESIQEKREKLTKKIEKMESKKGGFIARTVGSFRDKLKDSEGTRKEELRRTRIGIKNKITHRNKKINKIESRIRDFDSEINELKDKSKSFALKKQYNKQKKVDARLKEVVDEKTRFISSVQQEMSNIDQEIETLEKTLTTYETKSNRKGSVNKLKSKFLEKLDRDKHLNKKQERLQSKLSKLDSEENDITEQFKNAPTISVKRNVTESVGDRLVQKGATAFAASMGLPPFVPQMLLQSKNNEPPVIPGFENDVLKMPAVPVVVINGPGAPVNTNDSNQGLLGGASGLLGNIGGASAGIIGGVVGGVTNFAASSIINRNTRNNNNNTSNPEIGQLVSELSQLNRNLSALIQKEG